MMLKEHVRDARHRIAEIVGGLTGPQDYELDCVLTAIFDDLLAVQRHRGGMVPAHPVLVVGRRKDGGEVVACVAEVELLLSW